MENFEMEKFWLKFVKISNPEKYSSRKNIYFWKYSPLRNIHSLENSPLKNIHPWKNIHLEKYSALKVLNP